MVLNADLERLRATSHAVAQLHGDIANGWSRITKQAEDLFGSSWHGIAADSYAEPWAHCCDGFEHVLTSLDSMGRALVEAAQTYTEQEASNTRVIEGAASPPLLNLS
ncbi:WXG100 family type VII secretion target [Streptomyces sp. SID6673]|nr:WXG100 family type VII secretion target [Streptomyces sp. SID11726]NEB26637.1 WXG100 family type VII secretion target [Streptomyces sp. SID6673]